MPSNQKKIRDIERMIKRFGESPELLAKLNEAKHGKEEVQLKEKMRKNATKYHMVRFLERKKVTRKIRSIESKLKSEGDSPKLQKTRDSLMDDLAYIMYYPMEHKYIALYPSKETAPYEHNDSDGDGDGGKHDVEKSALLSKKARAVALQRWAEDKQRVADGVEGAVDKVAHAMEVAYQGGAAVNGEGKEGAKKEKKSKSKADKAGKQTGQKQSPGSEDAGEGSDSSDTERDSSSESSDSDAESEVSEQPTVPVKRAAAPSAKVPGAKPVTKDAKKTTAPAPAPAPAAAKEDSDSEGDDFFVEEASDSELANASVQPKVYNDGNAHRFKGDSRMSVHEIRFAATKRKYERHKRVFNNQNKRANAQDRKKTKQG